MSIDSLSRQLKAGLPLCPRKLHFASRTHMAEQDPVCGMMVDPAKAAGQHEHKGALYCFCSPSCLARFKADPDKFLAPSFRPIGMSTTGLTDRTSSSPSSTTASACPWLPAYSTRCWPAALAHDRQRGHEPLVGLGHRQCAPLAQAGPVEVATSTPSGAIS
jgi:YHS domain-containing protein